MDITIHEDPDGWSRPELQQEPAPIPTPTVEVYDPIKWGFYEFIKR